MAADEIIIETTSQEVIEVGVVGPQGPQGPKGDPGDVAGSVNWSTITNKPATFVPSAHAVEHEPGNQDELQATAVLAATDVVALNGVYFWDGTTTGGRPNFFKTGTRKNTKIVYNSGTGQWNLVRNTVIQAIGTDGPSTVPWGQETWEDTRNPAQVTNITVTRLPLETMVQKLAETGSTSVATTSEDGLLSASDKIKLNGIASGAEVNVNADWNASSGDAQILNKPSSFTPSAHAAAHSSTGSDPVLLDQYSQIEQAIAESPSDLLAEVGLNADSNVTFRSLSLREDVNAYLAAFSAQNITASRSFSVPNASGTLALTSDIPSTFAASAITSGTLTHERGGLEADVSAYNGLVKISGGATSAVTVTTAGEALLDDVDAAAQRTTLGLGTLATQSGTFSGTSSGTNTGDQTITLTGDVTGSGTGSFAATIANDAVTYAKLQNISATSRILGRKTAAAGDTEECTLSEVLDFVGSAAQGDILYRGASTWTRLAAGTSGHYLKTNGSGNNPEWAAVSGGSGGTKTYAVFTATDNQPPSSAFATLDTRGTGIAVLDFDAATDENAVFVGIMPEGASLGSGLIVRLHWMATSATSGNVRWGVQFERSNTDLDADSFAAAVEANGAANGTSGILTTTAITVTDFDGITAGDVFRLKVFRNADDATNDTMTGDAELVAVEVRSAA